MVYIFFEMCCVFVFCLCFGVYEFFLFFFVCVYVSLCGDTYGIIVCAQKETSTGCPYILSA